MTVIIGKKEERALRTIKQVIAERPFATERWLRRLIYEKRLRYFKVGGKVLIDLNDLDELVESGKVEPPAPAQIVGRRLAGGALT